MGSHILVPVTLLIAKLPLAKTYLFKKRPPSQKVLAKTKFVFFKNDSDTKFQSISKVLQIECVLLYV